MFKAASSTEMAQKLAVDPAALAESVDGAGLGRPLHAMGPVFSMLTVTEGGLDVDDCLRVLSASGEPIPGLWAVGGVGQGGMLLKGHGHHIAWAMTSGRLAGAAAARRLEAGSPTATTAATRTA
jgi:fumarate reductase flavoprotein subunit